MYVPYTLDRCAQGRGSAPPVSIFVSPSVKTFGFDTSLAEGGKGIPCLWVRGTDSHASLRTGSE